MGFQNILNDTSESNMSKFKKLSAILLLGACILIFLGLSVYCGLILINRENRQNQITSKSNRNYNSTENLASDNVKLIKVSNFKLHDNDLLYESLRNLNTFNINNKSRGSVISATDTFRSKSSQIWDPHPEYILKAFGHQLHLVLHQDNSFIATDTFKVSYLEINTNIKVSRKTRFREFGTNFKRTVIINHFLRDFPSKIKCSKGEKHKR